MDKLQFLVLMYSIGDAKKKLTGAGAGSGVHRCLVGSSTVLESIKYKYLRYCLK